MSGSSDVAQRDALRIASRASEGRPASNRARARTQVPAGPLALGQCHLMGRTTLEPAVPEGQDIVGDSKSMIGPTPRARLVVVLHPMCEGLGKVEQRPTSLGHGQEQLQVPAAKVGPLPCCSHPRLASPHRGIEEEEPVLTKQVVEHVLVASGLQRERPQLPASTVIEHGSAASQSYLLVGVEHTDERGKVGRLPPVIVVLDCHVATPSPVEKCDMVRGESQPTRIVEVSNPSVIHGCCQRFCLAGFVTDQHFEVFEILGEHALQCSAQHICLA